MTRPLIIFSIIIVFLGIAIGTELGLRSRPVSPSSSSPPSTAVYEEVAPGLMLQGAGTQRGGVILGTSSEALPPRDSFLKGSAPAVYYYAADGYRYIFPNEKTLRSWFSEYPPILSVSDDILGRIPLRGNITYRPAVRPVKIQTSPKVYAVGQGGVLRWITSEALAEALYGKDWVKKIDDIPDVFFVNYQEGNPITDPKTYEPEKVLSETNTINQDRNIPESERTPRATSYMGGVTIPVKPQAKTQPPHFTPPETTPLPKTLSPQPSATSTPTSTPPDSLPPTTPQVVDNPGFAPTAPQDTAPPLLSDIQTTQLTETIATIAWRTNEPTSGEVRYARVSIHPPPTTTAASTTPATSHSITLSALTPATTYTYTITAYDGSGNSATSTAQSFTTLSPPPPIQTTDGQDDPSGEDILVVYNTDYVSDQNNNGIQDSREIAEAYQNAREIPPSHLCGITAPTVEEITLASFDAEHDPQNSQSAHVRQQIESCLENRGIKLLVDYIVLVKGIPLKISGPGKDGTSYQLSVDQGVARLFQDHAYGRINNVYQPSAPEESYRPFKSHQAGSTLSYLVGRLDGYTVDDVIGMIERARQTPQTGSYAWVIDDHKSYFSYAVSPALAQVYDALKREGQKVYPTSWPSTTEELNQWITTSTEPIIGYTSNGIHAGMPDGYMSSVLKFQYENGAIVSTFESFNGFGFIAPTQSEHGQVAEFIAAGGSGGVGNVYEPFLNGLPNVLTLFNRYLEGYTFGEAAYKSLKYANWMTTVVGDPLMRIAPSPLAFPSSKQVTARVKVWLEGPYDKEGNTMKTTLRDRNMIPTTSPYPQDPRTISSMPPTVVDWALIQLRRFADGFPTVSKSVLLRNDGTLVTDDGSSDLITIDGIGPGSYYIVIRHRTHLAVMSAQRVPLSDGDTPVYDFTTGAAQYYKNRGAKELEPGAWGMFAFDLNQDQAITTADYTMWSNDAHSGASGYVPTDANLDGEVTTSDYTFWYNNGLRAGASSSVPRP